MEQNKLMLDRTLYKTIKNMDRAAMDRFIQNVWQQGYDDAHENVAVVDTDEIRKELSEVNGIGEKRLNVIMEIIEKHITK